jgi:PAS domain S-box-containing protein
MSSAARQSAMVLLFSGGYFVSILAGQALSLAELKFATFWPAAGWLLAALATVPKPRWAQYVFAACVINVFHAVAWEVQPLTTALIFMVANVLEGVLGGLCLQYAAAGIFQFATIRQVLSFAAISVTAPLVGSLLGVWGLPAVQDAASFRTFFQLWWQADSVGILLVTPLYVTLAARWMGREPNALFTHWLRYWEAIVLYVGLCVVAWLTFSPFTNSPIWGLIGLIYVVALLAWAGLRFSRLGATIASTLVVTITLYHTTRGDGLFALATDVPMMQVMSLQSFALVTMLTPLLFATVIDDQRLAEEKLRHNLSILQSVLDNTSDLIYVKDLEGRYLLVNQAGADLIQRPVSTIIGRRDVEVIPSEITDSVRQRDQLVYAAGRALTFEETSSVGGKKHTFLTTKNPYRNAAGEIVGLVGLSRDVTQRIEQLEALAESEQRYRTLVTSSNIGIYETDRQGKCVYLNPRWSQLTGRPVEFGLGNGWAECLHPHDRQSVAQAFQTSLATGAEFRMEYRYLTPGGAINWVLGTAVPIRDAADNVTGYLGNVIDITDQKRAVLELQVSEERFRRVADSAPVLIWTATPEGRFTYCNRRWLDFTGRTMKEELGHGWLENVHPSDRQQCLAAYTDSEEAKDAFHLEYRLRRHDGEFRWVHHEGSPKFSSNGDFRGFIGSCFDITDQRRATETLQRAKEELELRVAERTAALQAVNEQLQQLLVERSRAEEDQQQQQTQLAHVSRLSVMGEMAAGLAHELNQPLFAIQNYTAGILRRWSGPDDCSQALRDIIQQIAQESTRAAVIIRRVRDFARKQLGERVALPLNAVIEEVLQLLASEIRQHHVEVRLLLADQLPAVLIDRVQLQQVLVNLIRNALEAMEGVPPPTRVLTISTLVTTGEIRCKVEDSGPGIPHQDWKRLFEPFFTTKRAGLGMGLSISRSIVESHGGQLQAETTQQGAVFHFTIPLLEDQADDAAADHADRVLGGR